MTTTTTTKADLRTREVAVGDYFLHVHTVGDPADPTILWLHGSGPGVSALSNWERLITTMPGFHHVAPDVLGFGESSHPEPAPVGMTAFTRLRAQTTIALLDALGIKKAHAVGNSMGGIILLDLLSLAPERVGRVVLMGSGGSPVPPTTELIEMVSYYGHPGKEAMAGLMRNFVHDTATFAGRLDEIAEDRVAKAGRPEVRRSHLATFDMTSGPLRFDPGLLAGLPHEALVVHGREDKMIPVEAGVWLATHLPNAQLHVLPHAGHWVQIEQVDRFRALATLFLNEETRG